MDIVKTEADYCKGLASALQGTMLCRMVRCIINVFTEMYNFLQTRIPGITLTHTLSLFSPSKIDVGTVVGVELRREICDFFHQIVKNLYLNNPLNVRCSAIETLKKIYCPASPPQDRSDENIKAYHAQLQTTTEQLVELLLQYFNDCFCQAILPPCPPEPADNRMILACLTIKNDKIVNICNLSCRRYAGSFTSLSYWFPIRQVMGILLQTLCCDQNFFKIVFPIFRPLARMFVPARMLYQKVSEDNFATFKMYSHQFEEIFNKISPENLETFMHPNAVNLATLIDKPVADVNAVFEKADVSPVWREVTSIEEVPLWKSLTTFPFVSPGKKVVAYRMGDKVLGFERYEEHKKVSEEQIEIETLKKEIMTLKDEMAVLRKRVEQP